MKYFRVIACNTILLLYLDESFTLGIAEAETQTSSYYIKHPALLFLIQKEERIWRWKLKVSCFLFLIHFSGSLGIFVVTAMWKWTFKMSGFLTCENIIFGIPSSFSQATMGQFLEWWVIPWLLVIPSHKSCKWDDETHLVSISSYVASLSSHHRSQEVFQSKNPHFHLRAFLILKQKISSFYHFQLHIYPSFYIEAVSRNS